MKLSFFAVIGGLLAQASAAPTPGPYVVHEKRDTQTTKWSRSTVKLPHDAVILMSIGLPQRNLENGYEFLMDVAHPESLNYGKTLVPSEGNYQILYLRPSCGIG